MKKRIAVRIALAAGTTLALAQPAGATYGGIHPAFFAEHAYFQCEGDSKLQNPTLPAPWTTMVPSATIQDGEVGCFASDPAVYPPGTEGTESDAVFQGTFTGNLRDLTVNAHLFGPSITTEGGIVRLEISLSIDGQQLMSQSVRNVPVDAADTGLFRPVKFTIADLGCAREVRDAEGNVTDVVTGGLATEDGYGSTQHNLELRMGYAGNIHHTRAGHVVWTWGSSDLGSGIRFNPNSPAYIEPTKFQPTTPATCN